MPPHPLTNFEIYYESEPKIIANFCRILANVWIFLYWIY